MSLRRLFERDRATACDEHGHARGRRQSHGHRSPSPCSAVGGQAAATIRRGGQRRRDRARQARERRPGGALAPTQGVGIRRSGGLGSSTRFSLNGMTDEQIRFFLDGVPLDLTGFVERVEIYRGVVPSRFGVDALGGAVNLVTDDDYRHTRASASYQGGSFGTSRVTAAARHRFGDGPLVLRGHVSSPSSKATASSSTNPSPVRS